MSREFEPGGVVQKLEKATGEIPPCHIRIDKDGIWYYKGCEIIRKDIFRYFNQHITTGPNGRFVLQINNEKCSLEVEDTPFVVKRVDYNSGFRIVLNDESEEVLQLDTLWISNENVLYCKVKDKRFDARFNRASYYEFTKHIMCDEERERYFIPTQGKRYYLERRER